MRKLTVFFLAILIMLQCSIKAGIVAYFHLNQEYIASTLCENKENPNMHCKGKCYLNKKIKTQDKHENKLSSILKELKDGNLFMSSAVGFSLSPSAYTLHTDRPVYIVRSYLAPLADILQPPC